MNIKHKQDFYKRETMGGNKQIERHSLGQKTSEFKY